MNLGVPGSDVPIDASSALLFSEHAPLTPGPGTRDARAVWATVPGGGWDGSVVVFFHGYDNYVTIDAGGESRVPDWVADDPTAAAGARAKRAAPLVYGLDALSPKRAGPLVLVPEVASLAHGDFWATEPRGQYADPARMGALIDDCRARLACLNRPDRQAYLTAEQATCPPRRLRLCGHSGAGLPLVEAASSHLALPDRGVPTDLWLLDCTYWSDTKNFAHFCRAWGEADGMGGAGPTASRFVCVYRSGTETEEVADALRHEIAADRGVAPAALVRDHVGAGKSEDNFGAAIRPALTSAVLFVRTDLPHDEIPTYFIPRLLSASDDTTSSNTASAE